MKLLIALMFAIALVSLPITADARGKRHHRHHRPPVVVEHPIDLDADAPIDLDVEPPPPPPPPLDNGR